MSPKAMSGFIRQDYREAIDILGGKKDINSTLVNLYQSNMKAVAAFVNDNGTHTTIRMNSVSVAMASVKRLPTYPDNGRMPLSWKSTAWHSGWLFYQNGYFGW